MIENLAALSLLKKRELGEIRSLGEQKMTLPPKKRRRGWLVLE